MSAPVQYILIFQDQLESVISWRICLPSHLDLDLNLDVDVDYPA